MDLEDRTSLTATVLKATEMDRYCIPFDLDILEMQTDFHTCYLRLENVSPTRRYALKASTIIALFWASPPSCSFAGYVDWVLPWKKQVKASEPGQLQ